MKNSNLSEIEYRNREKQLKSNELDECKKLKENLYDQFAYSRIVGFETKEGFTERLRKFINDNNSPLDLQNVGNNYMANLQETEFRKFKEEMTQVIEKLLNEKIFTEEAENMAFKNDFKEIKKSDNPKKEDISQLEKEAQMREKDRLLLKEVTKPAKTQRKKITCLVGKYLLDNEAKVNASLKNYKWNDFFNVQAKDKLMLKKADIPVINSSSIERSSDEQNIQSNYQKCVDLLSKAEVISL